MTRAPSAARTARVIVSGHAFVQNLRRGHYELGLTRARTGVSRSH